MKVGTRQNGLLCSSRVSHVPLRFLHRAMLISCNECQWFRARPPGPFCESDTACELRFQIATVLAHVCKMRASACHKEHILEAHGTPAVTHTQWFLRRSCAGNSIRARCVLPRAVRCGPCQITKRYVCAAKSFGNPLGILAARPADLRNAMCVRPARFRPSRQATTRPSGPVEGTQTLRT